MLAKESKLERFLDSDRSHEWLAFLIIINAAVLGLETIESVRNAIGTQLYYIDHALLYFFLAELIVRVIAYGPRFFKDGWNVFDAFVILIALVPTGGAFSSLRALRILRVMRLISLFPQMRIVVSSVLKAVPGIISVAGILLLMFYIVSIIAHNLFATASPSYFGTLGGLMYTLFQLMLADDWGNVTRPILETHPHAYLFFIPFVILMTFTVLNLFFGLIVNAMQGAAEEENAALEKAEDKKNDDSILALKNELTKVQKQLVEIKELLKKS